MKFTDLFEAEVPGDLHNLTHEVLVKHGMEAGSGLDEKAPKNKYLFYGQMNEPDLSSDIHSLGWKADKRQPDRESTTFYSHESDPTAKLSVTHWKSPIDGQVINHAKISGVGQRRLN